MRLLTCLLTENRCYKESRTIKPRGIMVHSTGSSNPMLKRYVQPVASTPNKDNLLRELGINHNYNHWNRPGSYVSGKWVPLNACVHAFVGKLDNGSVAVAQTLPWNHRGWHAGTGTSGRSANDTHISFEICEDGLTDPTYFQQVYQAAVELTAMLCKEYGLDPLADGVVICHQDGYRRGIASNHGDVYNWFPKHSKNMDDFRADVIREMKGEIDMSEEQVRRIVREEYARMEAERAALPASAWAEGELAAAMAAGITNGTRPQDLVTREEAAIMALRGSHSKSK